MGKMYISNIINTEELNVHILQTLRIIGVKHRYKKLNSNKLLQFHKHNTGTKIFKRPLNQLDCQPVDLESGATVEIPLFVAEACGHITKGFDVEGIFRKAGSTARQREIKAYVDNGKNFGSQHHVVDVANILKLFFRELPDPLLPYSYHDLFMRCLLVKDKKVDCVLLTCLLLPTPHLYTLAYLMEFLQKVSSHADANKMGVSNLAIIITPSVMPVEEKMALHSGTRLVHHVEVVEILIRNAVKIGVLPETIVGKISLQSSNDELDRKDGNASRIKRKKKKRRSGSLTRMFNGLKKMVGKGSPEVDENLLITSTTDFSTPCMKSTKKRKSQELSNAFSSKKRRDILQALPQSVALANVPCTPMQSVFNELYLTPKVCAHPTPSWKSKSPPSKQKSRRFFTPKPHSEIAYNKTSNGQEKSKKSRLSIGSRRSNKKQKFSEDSGAASQASSDTSCQSEASGQRSFQEWRWSGGLWGRKKTFDTPMEREENLTDPMQSDNTSGLAVPFEAEIDLSDNISDLDNGDSTEFVRIPKHEYEAIKNRVSAIENRISQEFGNIASNSVTEEKEIPNMKLVGDETSCNNAKSVQSAYEKTLEESEKFEDTSTNQLAKRLSKELKIRRSLENKVIRSPSARKIGTIRRRSRENVKPLFGKSPKRSEVSRNKTWHLSMRPDLSQLVGPGESFYPRSSLRRGKPNTVYSGLPQPSPMRVLSGTELEDVRIRLAFENDRSQKAEVKDEVLHDDQSSLDLGKELKNYRTISSEALYDCDGPITRSHVQRASSFHGSELFAMRQSMNGEKDLRKVVSQMNITQASWLSGLGNLQICADTEITGDDQWQSADRYFQSHSQENKEPTRVSGRASIAKLRSQNAGMVMARMRLFNGKVDPNNPLDNSPSGLGSTEISSVDTVESKELIQHSEMMQSLPVNFQDTCKETRGLTSQHLQNKYLTKFSQTQVISCAKDSVFNISQDILRGSPKKIGSPRKKFQSNKSPKGSHKKQKLKVVKSSAQKEELQSVINSTEKSVKKSNSLKLPSLISSSPRNNVTAPAKCFENGKENLSSPNNQRHTRSSALTYNGNLDMSRKIQFSPQMQLPDTLKETIYSICTPIMDKLSKMSVSPLKDCNRIDINTPTSVLEINRLAANKDTLLAPNTLYRTPRETPYIKKPLLVKSPAQFGRTPQNRVLSADRIGRRLATPLRAMSSINTGTPLGSPRRQSPRLLLMKARNLH